MAQKRTGNFVREARHELGRGRMVADAVEEQRGELEDAVRAHLLQRPRLELGEDADGAVHQVVPPINLVVC